MTSSKDSKIRPHSFYAGLLLLLTLWMSLPGLDSVPVIDRDEARYAQATVQMVESGDYLNIEFQDRARNKKPAGIYWMQALPVKLFSEPGDREIWIHRIPSVLAGLIAVLATYWAGGAMMGRRAAFIGAAILATSTLFVFETHIAKTDAMLCAMAALAMAALIHLRNSPKASYALIFWVATATAIMIKGPIVPAIVALTLLGLLVWEREAKWMRALINWPGIILAGLIVIPWSVMMWIATDGAFFTDAIRGDLAPKLAGGQEKHGAAPGYYLATLPLLFWPGTLFLVCGLVLGVRAAQQKSKNNEGIAAASRLLLLWIIPYWMILELVPTKLPNYLLPVYPALAILCGGAISAMLQVGGFKISRRLGAGLFFIASLLLVIVILSGEALYADVQSWAMWVSIFWIGLIFYGFGTLWAGKAHRTLPAALILALTLSFTTYQFIMPRLDRLFVSHKIEQALTVSEISLPRRGGPRVLSPHFTEPSLVFRLGTDIVLGDKVDQALTHGLRQDDILLLDLEQDDSETYISSLSELGCFEDIMSVEGLNYSRGEPVHIVIQQPISCQEDAAISRETQTEGSATTPVP